MAGARRFYERSLRIHVRATGPDYYEVGVSYVKIASVLIGMSEFAEAGQLLERALPLVTNALGPDHPHVGYILVRQADGLRRTGNTAAGVPLLERALAILEKRGRLDDTSWCLRALGNTLWEIGDYAGARSAFERSVVECEIAMGDHSYLTAHRMIALARFLFATGETQSGLDVALRSEAISADHLRLTSRILTETKSLRYAGWRQSGLDLALSIATAGLEPGLRDGPLNALNPVTGPRLR